MLSPLSFPSPLLPPFLSPPHSLFCSLVVPQAYESEVNNEYVIRGNSAILKCNIPSYVADFVSVQAWVDSESNVYYPSSTDGNDMGGEWVEIWRGRGLVGWVGGNVGHVWA